MDFIRSNGEVVAVNQKDVNVIEKNGSYTLYGARHNPTGEQLVSVVYDNDEGFERYTGVGDIDNSDGNFVTDNDIGNNPSRKTYSWRNLRLQSAISGQVAVSGRIKETVSQAVGKLRSAGSVLVTGKLSSSQSIRDDPILYIVDAKDWYKYIKNMNTVDIGAEFAAGVSDAQRASVALFASEWEMDPGHENLKRRMLPGADYQDAVAKGQIAYDVLTRGRDILGKKGYGANNSDVMHRLCFDIVRSLPISQYNYYSLYQLHPDEGNQIYSEFKSRYVPLDAAEVEMILEMGRYLESEGDAYAFRTTSNEQTGVLASKLMKSAVAAYDIGDTVTARTALMALQSPPYNYRPRHMTIAMTSGDSSALAVPPDRRLTFMQFTVVNQNKIDTYVSEGSGRKLAKDKVGFYTIGVEPAHLDKMNSMNFAKDHADKYQTVQIATSATDPTPKYIAVRASKPKGGKSSGKQKKSGSWTIIDYDKDYLRIGTDNERGRAAKGISRGLGLGGDPRSPGGGGGGGRGRSDKKSDDRKPRGDKSGGGGRKPKGGGGKDPTREIDGKRMTKGDFVKSDLHKGNNWDAWDAAEGTEQNPRKRRKNPVGRGKLFHVELHPKTQLTMKKREPARGKQKGETRHGAGKPTKDKKKGQTYWTKGVSTHLPSGQMLQLGILKKTGEDAPFRIRFPTSHFAVVRHPTAGFKTIMPKKAKTNKAFMKTYQDFINYYGLPKHAPSKDTYYRFIIPKSERLKSKYYQEIRKKVSKK